MPLKRHREDREPPEEEQFKPVAKPREREREKPADRVDWKLAFEILSKGVEPFINAVRTLDDDVKEADKIRDPGSYNGAGFGKSFACFRARSRLAYADFEKFNSALKELNGEEDKTPPPKKEVKR